MSCMTQAHNCGTRRPIHGFLRMLELSMYHTDTPELLLLNVQFGEQALHPGIFVRSCMHEALQTQACCVSGVPRLLLGVHDFLPSSRQDLGDDWHLYRTGLVGGRPRTRICLDSLR